MKIALESKNDDTVAKASRVMEQFFTELSVVQKLFFAVNADGVSETTALWTTQEAFDRMVAQLGSTFVNKVPVPPDTRPICPGYWRNRGGEDGSHADCGLRFTSQYPGNNKCFPCAAASEW